MSEEQEILVPMSPEMARAFNNLVQELGPDRVIKLAEMCVDVKSETGYGGVEIKYSWGRVKELSLTKYFLRLSHD